MVMVSLTPGRHTIKMSLSGYETLNAEINVSTIGTISCVSVGSGMCGSATPPGVTVAGSTVIGYLKESPVTPISSFDDWVLSKGGADGITGNLLAVGEIIDGYLGIKDFGFTVSLGNVGSVIDYYLGLVI